MEPIFWYEKNQNTFGVWTYSSERMALKIAAEEIISLSYKLRRSRNPID
jgi:hypothetical protein